MRTASPSRARRAAVLVLTLAVSSSLLTAGYAVAAGKKTGGSCRHNCTSTTPSVSISNPAPNSILSGTVTVSGSATDAVGIASVGVSVDSGAYQTASGTSSWAFPLDTTTYLNGTHTISARATDTGGNTKVTSEFVTVNNTAPSPSPTPTPTPTSSPSPSPSPTSSPSPSHWVSPEGVTIDINSAGPWTMDQIYSMLKASARDLSIIGPHLTIEVQDTTSSSCAASAGTTNGVYTSFNAIIYLKGVNSTFSTQPDAQIAHEYGHAWTLYHLYMTHNGNWSSYLSERWTASDGSVTLATDPRLDSTYAWTRSEIIAEDYRLLFGSSLAKSERPTAMNTDIPAPTAEPSLSGFLLNTWA
jgi:hypothetical protein